MFCLVTLDLPMFEILMVLENLLQICFKNPKWHTCNAIVVTTATFLIKIQFLSWKVSGSAKAACMLVCCQ